MTRKEEVEGKRQTKRKGTKAPKAGTGHRLFKSQLQVEQAGNFRRCKDEKPWQLTRDLVISLSRVIPVCWSQCSALDTSRSGPHLAALSSCIRRLPIPSDQLKDEKCFIRYFWILIIPRSKQKLGKKHYLDSVRNPR